MRRHGLSIVATVAIVTITFLATLVSSWRPLLGLDLQGGVSVVLFPVEGSDTDALDVSVGIIRNRIDALGVVEPEVSRQGDTIVIDLPGTEDRQEALDLIGQTAQLRFRPVCGFLPPEDPSAPEEEPQTFVTNPIPECVETGTAGSGEGAAGGVDAPGVEVVPQTGVEAPPSSATSEDGASPTTVLEGDAVGARRIETEPIANVRPAQEAPSTTASDAAPSSTVAPSTTVATPTTVAPETEPSTTTLPDEIPGAGVPTTPREDDLDDAIVVLPGRDEDAPQGEGPLRYVLGPAVLTGDAVTGAKAQFVNQWFVEVDFEGDSFAQSVGIPLVGQQVAIVLDGVVVSAPTINDVITGSTAVIEGGQSGFSEGEARDLALVLRYGSLPVQFDPTEQTVRSISPTLGSDQLRAGVIAGLVGLFLVAVYMIALYRLLGLVVVAGLGLTGMIFFTMVSWLSEWQGLTLTLAGVTGLIVSVGVTVDSYVVYFERLKDEVRAGRTVRAATESGFRKSFRTIVAADLVSLMGAVVLWSLAEGSVRGFAFFLGLSTIIDLVLSYFFMYPCVVLLARRPRLVKMAGFGLASGLDVAGAES